MFNSKTLFVLGAGASKEVGLPTGEELKNQIASKLNFTLDTAFGIDHENPITEAFAWKAQKSQVAQRNIKSYFEAANHIARAMPIEPSIDQFIDNHRGNNFIEFCGKLAIVDSILEAERNSEIYVNYDESEYTPEYGNIKNSWYNKIIQILCTDCHIDKIEEIFTNVSFIVFNYDRCLEHILYHALQSKYGISDGHAADVLAKLTIIHPYGSVGKLAWQFDESPIRYGEKATPNGLVALTDEIKTFTERVEDQESIDEMKDLVFQAKNIVFLGFAFHSQNIQLMQPDPSQDANPNYSRCGV